MVEALSSLTWLGLNTHDNIIFNKHMQNEMVCFAYFCEILASYDWNNLWEWTIALHGMYESTLVFISI